MRFLIFYAVLLFFTSSLISSPQVLAKPAPVTLKLPLTGLFLELPDKYPDTYEVKSHYTREADGHTASDVLLWTINDLGQFTPGIGYPTKTYTLRAPKSGSSKCQFGHSTRVDSITLGGVSVDYFKPNDGSELVSLCHPGNNTKVGLWVTHSIKGLNALSAERVKTYLSSDVILEGVFTAYGKSHFGILAPPLLNAEIEDKRSESLPNRLGESPLSIERPKDHFEWREEGKSDKTLHLYSPLPVLAPVKVKLAVQEGKHCNDLKEIITFDVKALNLWYLTEGYDDWLVLTRLNANLTEKRVTGNEYLICREIEGATYWARSKLDGPLSSPRLYKELLSSFVRSAQKTWPRHAKWPDFIIEELPKKRLSEGEYVTKRPSRPNFDYLEFSLMANVSIHRNEGLNTKYYPGVRMQGLGGRANYYDVSGGFILGLTGAIAFDLISGKGVSTASRWGDDFFRVSAEIGYCWGRAWFFGFTVGGSVMSGPLTVNNSIPLSLIAGHAPWDESDWGLLIKVTPAQFFSSNQRDFLSPLLVDVTLTSDGEGFGFEIQYLDKVSGAETGIGLGGWSFGFKYGMSAFFR